MKPLPNNTSFRVTVLTLAALLAAQAIWLVGAQALDPAIDRLPTNASAAAAAARHRDAAALAARIGGVRGDLWAQSAYTYADLLWDTTANPDPSKALASARFSLKQALREAPDTSDAWLMLAALASRDRSPGTDVTQALKMSYYTGPSERWLTPLRFRLAVHSDFVGDIEMRQFISRDLRLLLSEQQKPVITQAYLAASPAGRDFIEGTIGDIDPSARSWLRASAEPPPLPN